MRLFGNSHDGRWSGAARRLRGAAARLARCGVNLLFPPRCAACQADLPDDADHLLLCQTCTESLAPAEWPGCRRCGALLAKNPAGAIPECTFCQDVPLRFDAVFPLGGYDGPLRDAVLRTKRLSQEGVSMALGKLLAQRRGGLLADFRPNFIVPIPMHWWRRLGRGVNSPEILARCLGQYLKVPVLGQALVRCRNTRPQKDLLPSERFQNLRGAFRIRRQQQARLRDSRVLLIDDILTTGATSSEAARVLKQAGAAAVAVAVVAKAQGH
jgi:ComF family protein